MKINVLEDDIRKAVKGVSTHCPIALAVKRAVGRDCSVYPNWPRPGIIYFDIGVQTVRVPLPNFVNRIAYTFDNGVTLEPFEFELPIEVPEPEGN